MSYFLTFPGHLLCQQRENGPLQHYPIDAIPDDFAPLRLDIDIATLRRSPDAFVRNAHPAIDSDVTLGTLGVFRIAPASDGRCVNFVCDDGCLSAFGGIALRQAEASEWEAFLPISQSELEVLRSVLANAWVVGST